ncbi:MAG: DUF1624 domain-containing protein [Candidatus Dadabacteria bacterium]
MEVTLTAPRQLEKAVIGKSYRVESIDLLRGLVMIIMALDHTRDFFHKAAMIDDPLNFATTTPLLFFTRWITHFCAPVFVFLAGTSAWFQSKRKTTAQLSAFLIKRGLWLLFIEVVVITFAFSFNPSYPNFFLQTIWAIGISMIILGLMLWLPFNVILITGLLIVLGHNTLDFYEARHVNQPISTFYDFLHRPNLWPIMQGHNVLILYPFLPWAGLMMLGYCFGRLFSAYQGEQRRKMLSWLGLGIIAFFIVLRATNLYGNPEHWHTQKNSLFTFFSFIDTHKYPPSLLYMCMTIGPALLFVALFDKIKNRFTDIITVYGRVPFFYYVLHFYLLHIVCMILFLARGHSWAEGINVSGIPGFRFVIAGEGYSLPIVYLVWLLVVIALYPACKWFSEYKKTHSQWWVSYL